MATPTQPSKADINAPAQSTNPRKPKGPERPFDEVLRDQAGVLAVKLLRNGHIRVEAGVDAAQWAACQSVLSQLATFVAKPPAPVK